MPTLTVLAYSSSILLGGGGADHFVSQIASIECVGMTAMQIINSVLHAVKSVLDLDYRFIMNESFLLYIFFPAAIDVVDLGLLKIVRRTV